MRWTGFTLIELIVVIAVLVLLLAILAPTLSSSRERAKTVKCSLNIKGLMSGLAAYDTENDSLPYGFNDDRALGVPPGDYAGNKQIDKVGWWWFDYLEDIYQKRKKEKNVLWCPANRLKDSTFDGNVLCGNYGVNQSICKAPTDRGFPGEFEGIPLASTSIRSPAETLLIVDAGYTLVNWWHATIEPPQTLNSTFIENTSYVPGVKINSERAVWPGQEHDAIDGRHPNKTVNVGFVDSHVDTKRADELLVIKHQEQYENYSPLWSPK